MQLLARFNLIDQLPGISLGFTLMPPLLPKLYVFPSTVCVPVDVYKRQMLDQLQEKAVKEAARNGMLIITGGPGTGKTTTINVLIDYFEHEGLKVRLAAPTGRAAKRMTEATGCDASTIHRLLELSGVPEENSGRVQFERNAQNPLEDDVIIIDEMSMVDIHLMHALLNAVSVGTRQMCIRDRYT